MEKSWEKIKEKVRRKTSDFLANQPRNLLSFIR